MVKKRGLPNQKQTKGSGEEGQTTTLLESLFSAVTGGDADSLLKSDHRKVERLFSRYESLGEEDVDEKADSVEKICKELTIHTMLEEELFYPACREYGVDDKILDEAQVEHDSAKLLIGELLSEAPNGPFYDAKVKTLSEYIKHHVGEEEKADGIFAKAREARMDLTALGHEIRDRKQQLLRMVDERGLPRPRPRSLQSLGALLRESRGGNPDRGRSGQH
jgi:hypothetical protein